MTGATGPRYAVYFTPTPGSPLARFGAAVLGYDSDTGRTVERASFRGIGPDDLERMTTTPARYGFHATLVAPFHLRETEADLRDAFSAFCTAHAPVPLGRLQLATFGGFIALRPTQPPPALAGLEGDGVRWFAKFRALESATDRDRRVSAGLTARQRDNLDRWGYPYVFEEFRLHLTLSGSLAPEQQTNLLKALSEAYAPLADESVQIDALSLMHQPRRDARFVVLHRRPLGGTRAAG